MDDFGEMINEARLAAYRACTTAQEKVCNEILEIMAVYHEQDERGNVDTPGGLEHMGDVWRLLAKW